MHTHAAKVRQKYRVPIYTGLVVAVVLLFSYTTLSTVFSRYLWNHGYHSATYFLNTKDAETAVQVGNYYFSSMRDYNIERAQKSYELAIALRPIIQQAHYQLARIYLVKGEFVKAKKNIDAELAINPSNLRSTYVRGLVDLAQNDESSAEFDFTRFTTWAPTEWGGYNDLAFTLAKEGKYAQSEAVIKKAFSQVIDATSTNPWLWNALGLAQLNQHKYADAASSFTEAATLAKQISPIEWERAYSANDPSAIATSIKTFQQAIEKNLYTAKRGDTIKQ